MGGFLRSLFGGKERAVPPPAPLPPVEQPEVYALLPNGGEFRKPAAMHQIVDQDEALMLRERRNAHYKSIDPGWHGWRDAIEMNNHPLLPEHVPRFGVFRPKLPKHLPDWESVSADNDIGVSYWVVSQRMKDALVPVVGNDLQFLPYELRAKDGGTIASYHVMHMVRTADSIDRVASRFGQHTRPDGTSYWSKPYGITQPQFRETLVLKRSALGPRIWIDSEERIIFVDPQVRAALQPFLRPGLDLYPVHVTG